MKILWSIIDILLRSIMLGWNGVIIYEYMADKTVPSSIEIYFVLMLTILIATKKRV